MNSLIQRSLLAAVVALPLAAFAQSAELLVPVTGQEEQHILKTNHYFVEQDRYVAKRLRIVRVNTDVLLGKADQITISPFEDVSIPVSRTELRVAAGGLSFVWDGAFSSVSTTRDGFVADQIGLGLDSKTANRLYETFFGLTITGAKYVFDEETGRTESLSGMRRDANSGRFVYETEKRRDALRTTEFYEVGFILRPPPQADRRGRLTDTPFSREFFLRSLPMDRRYHVIYEVDPQKTVPTGKIDPVLNPVAAEKVRRYREFVKSLGVDPRAQVSDGESQQ